MSGSDASYPFWLGGVAASMAASCTHPLDVTKVRLQTLQSLPGATKASIISVTHQSLQDYGFRSLYVGLSAALLRQMSYSLIRLGAYEKLKARLLQGGKKPSHWQLLMAASVAGGCGGIAGNPADILLVRMTSDVTRPPERRYNYPNAIAGLVSLIKEEGMRGLARGLGTNTTRAILMNASQVGSYDYFKDNLINQTLPLTDYKLRDNLVLHALSSCLAGTFATTICSPADVIRSRLMASSGNHSALRVIATSLRDEGPLVLFKGWTPAFIRLGPNTVLLFVFFEQLKGLWINAYEQQ